MNDIPLITSIIIEDDKVLREGYAHFINSTDGFKVLATYASSIDALQDNLPKQPNVILLDIEMPGLNGIDSIPALKKLYPEANIIILTVFDSEKLIFDALEKGATGYLTKNTSTFKLTQALKDTYEGGSPMSSNVARIVIKSFQKNQSSPLSKRETQILELISEGKNRSLIAELLFIDIETVKSHIKNIYLKLNVNSKSDALEFAKKNRLI